jgi:hypothetical protein
MLGRSLIDGLAQPVDAADRLMRRQRMPRREDQPFALGLVLCGIKHATFMLWTFDRSGFGAGPLQMTGPDGKPRIDCPPPSNRK